MSRHIKASEFKAKCLALMDEVARTGTAIIITKNGKPVGELVPHRPRKQNARGILKDELFITGDIMSPIHVEWEALKGSCLIRTPPSGLVSIVSASKAKDLQTSRGPAIVYRSARLDA